MKTKLTTILATFSLTAGLAFAGSGVPLWCNTNTMDCLPLRSDGGTNNWDEMGQAVTGKVDKAGDLTQLTAVGGTSNQVFKSNGDGTGSWGTENASPAYALRVVINSGSDAISRGSTWQKMDLTNATVVVDDLSGWSSANTEWTNSVSGRWIYTVSVHFYYTGVTVETFYIGLSIRDSSGTEYQRTMKMVQWDVTNEFNSEVLSVSYAGPISSGKVMQTYLFANDRTSAAYDTRVGLVGAFTNITSVSAVYAGTNP